jgi:hypothetical protein
MAHLYCGKMMSSLVWRGIKVEYKHTPEYIPEYHLFEIFGDETIPITTDGYWSTQLHFMELAEWSSVKEYLQFYLNR